MPYMCKRTYCCSGHVCCCFVYITTIWQNITLIGFNNITCHFSIHYVLSIAALEGFHTNLITMIAFSGMYEKVNK